MVYLVHLIPIFINLGERAQIALESTTEVVLLLYFVFPTDVCDTVLRGNKCVACDRRFGASKKN